MGNRLTYTQNPTTGIDTRIHLANLKETDNGVYKWPRAPNDPLYYRSYDMRPDPGPMAIWMKNPFTEIYDSTMNMQHMPLCGKIEMSMMNCYEAYGLPNGFYKCRDLTDDYEECWSENKRFKRIKIMRNERQRQHRHGEREIKYAMPPKPGSLNL